MKYFLLMIVTFILIGCGGSDTSNTEPTPIGNNIEDNETTQDVDKNTSARVINIYIHGYNKKGEQQTDTYGKDESDEVLESIAETTGYSTMENYSKDDENDIIAMTDYYGNKSPDYYTAQDMRDIENVEKGIPRYALIVAKYAKHVLNETGAENINIISASMGTLVSRYIIEKNLENLSADKKIKKWLSFEGVIKGNIAASKKNLVDILDTFVKQPEEVAQMKYTWVEDNLNLASPYYKDIQIGFESSTRDDLSKKVLTLFLVAENKFAANDGVQAVKDTFFDIPSTHTFFHENHASLADNKAVWSFAATFLTSKKHVRITLIEASVSNLHERFSSKAEIVFQSSVHSQKAQEKWGFINAIDERMLEGGYLKLYEYSTEGEAKVLNQEVFDSYILDEETELTLNVTPYELDISTKYGLLELSDKQHESLGQGKIIVPVKSGIYDIDGNDWSGKVKVEVMEQ